MSVDETATAAEKATAINPDGSAPAKGIATHNFWSQRDVPDRDSQEFRRVIFRKAGSRSQEENNNIVKSQEHHEHGLTLIPGNPDHDLEKEQDRTCQIFIPKDEHCGTWKSSPNPKCHASFGGGGTTASVSCYGDLIQMSQYLGAGHSGMFSMDQNSTDEPYFVRGRAQDLDGHAVSVGDDFSLVLSIPSDFCPTEPPEVKWVNWRWPRYEYETKVPNVKACFQYVVHNGAVLQQFVLTNSGDEPVEFQYHLSKDMLVRDLDYLDSSYPFNEGDEEIYTRVPGPNEYAHVCVAALNKPGRNESFQPGGGSATIGKPTADISQTQGLNSAPGIANYTSKPAAEANAPDFGPAGNVDMDTTTTNLIAGDESKAQANSGTAYGDTKPVEKPDQPERGPNSVAAIITLFVDGQAVQIQNQRGFWQPASLEGNKAGPNGKLPGTLEIVVSYKLILLPHGESNWRRFLVSAEEAHVNEILREETERLWKGVELPSICSLGLSLAEPVESTSPVTTPTNAKSDGISAEQKGEGERGSDEHEKPGNNHSVIETLAVSEENIEPVVSSPYHNPATTHISSDSQNFKLEDIHLPSGPILMGSPRSHIEYLAWRHLEHILSVCAIPVPGPTHSEAAAQKIGPSIFSPSASSEQDHRNDNVIIALTCGDMPGHRVCTSASFFAFIFLIDVARRLVRHPVQISYTKTLLKRIRHVLRGHIRWLEWLRMAEGGINKRLLESGCFAANYWVTGEIERSAHNGSWQPNESITDTPFQVLKIVEYIKFCNDCGDDAVDDKELANRILKDVWVPWFHELDKIDKRASFAWPHARKEGVETYRLVDHFWVWKALKGLEDLKISHDPPVKKAKDPSGPQQKPVWEGEEHKWTVRRYASLGLEPKQAYEKFGTIARRLHAFDTQRGILQRFTTENDISRKRMLAVTRSPRETRFLLHARDTALFYAADCGFFLPRSSFQELWANTLEAQIHHSENQETGWDNAIRYALGVVAGSRHWTLNQKSAEELVRKCVDVLISSCSHNGFFPGQLDEATKEPNLFYEEEDRDHYYHAGFEINHILLTHGTHIYQLFDKTRKVPMLRFTSASTLSSRSERAGSDSHLRPEKTANLPGIAVQNREGKLFDEPSPYKDRSRGVRKHESEVPIDGQRNLIMKKFIPFNSLIDATSIILIEEEWLYSYPHFLSPIGINAVEQIGRRLEPPKPDGGNEGNDSDSGTGDPSDHAVGGVVARELASYRSSEKGFSFSKPKSYESIVFIVDTPKQKRLGKREKKTLNAWSRVLPLHNVDLQRKLSTPRTAEQAKKRFIWFAHANAETALLCWAASPEQERPAISLFFDRHSRYEKYFWDDTTMVLNTWQTELHLSFYMLVDGSPHHHIGLPPPSRDKFPGSSRQELRRASVGFRFDGDFFDRYWTCHYIEHFPRGPTRDRWRFPFDTSGRHADKQWWQRKVLELFLLDGMLRDIAKSSWAILSEVRKEVGVGEGALSILSSEAYSSSKDNWQKFEQILQAVEEDLSSTLDILQKWTSREKDRGQEKPRWTRSDERKYRGPINKYQGLTERQIRDLGIRRDTIRNLKEKLATSRQKIRDDRELYRNENIRYFTYVTVIFLPLGFAASFYSMNGAPGSDLLISLVEFAMGAFAVTVALLASARTLSKAFEPLRVLRTKAGLAAEKYSRNVMTGSLIMKDLQTPQMPAERKETGRHQFAPPVDTLEPQERVEEVPAESLSPLSFWLTYLFIEKPARKVERAFSEMKSGVSSPRAVVNIQLGIVFLPVFAAAWVVKIVVINIRDMMELIRAIAKRLPQRQQRTKAQDKQDTNALLEHFRLMTHPPRASRPWRLLQEILDREPAQPTIGQRFEQNNDGKLETTVMTNEKAT